MSRSVPSVHKAQYYSNNIEKAELTISPSATRSRVTRTALFFSRYEVMVSILLGFFAFFNLMDLLSTSFALRSGLQESNVMLLGMAAAIGVNVIVIMALLKVIFVAGTVVLGVVGVKSANLKIRNMAMYSILAFLFVFVYVALNNVIIILMSQ